MTSVGLYQHRVTPFIMSNVPATFQKMIIQVVREEWKSANPVLMM